MNLKQKHPLFLHAVCVLLLAAVAFIVLGSMVQYHGLEEHMYITMSIGKTHDLLSCFTTSYVTYAPSFRPLTKVFYKVQFALFKFKPTPYYVSNMSIWILCAWTIFFLTYHFTASSLTSLIVGLAFLTAPELYQFKWATSSHNALSNLTGYSAILLFIRRPKSIAGYREKTIIFILLLASPLFKEYGLVFTGVIVAGALAWRRGESRGWIYMALSIILVYAGLRLFAAGGATSNYVRLSSVLRSLITG